MKKNGFKIYAIILTGLVFSLALTAMLISGKKSINPFYDVGAVSEVYDTYYRFDAQQEYGHQDASGRFVLDQGEYTLSLPALGYTDDWNYLCVWLEDLTVESVHWDITYEKADGSAVSGIQPFELTEGCNQIPVEKNGFDLVRIRMMGENGTEFTVTNIQFRENPPVFAWDKAIGIFAVVFVVFCCIVFAIYAFLKKLNIRWNIYCWVDILQELYILVAQQMRKLTAFIPNESQIRNYARSGLFLLMFLYSVYVQNTGNYYSRFKYHLFVYTVLILLTAVFAIGPKLEKKNWNHPLAWSWLILWAMVCISDFIIPKYFRFTGYVMLLAVGFFIFIWNNMEKPAEMTEDFVRAVHWFFVIIVAFCLFCRPERGAYRYSGFTTNPSIFALYLGTCWAVVLGELDSRIQQGDKLKKMLPYIVEGCLVLSFCWKSQSAGPLLCVAVLSFLWLVKMVRRTRKKTIRKGLIAVVFSAAILLIPVHAGLTWGLGNLAQTTGTAITLEGETALLKRDTTLVVRAAETDSAAQVSRLEQKFSSASLSQILSGRDCYYRRYLRDMNLFGHKANPKMWGHRRLPHNAVLGIAHRYGVFCAVPYVLMLTAVVIGTYRYGRKHMKYAGIPFYVCLSSIVMAMTDNVEQPFVWLPWIGLYIMLGCVFAGKSQWVITCSKKR